MERQKRKEDEEARRRRADRGASPSEQASHSVEMEDESQGLTLFKPFPRWPNLLRHVPYSNAAYEEAPFYAVLLRFKCHAPAPGFTICGLGRGKYSRKRTPDKRVGRQSSSVPPPNADADQRADSLDRGGAGGQVGGVVGEHVGELVACLCRGAGTCGCGVLQRVVAKVSCRRVGLALCKCLCRSVCACLCLRLCLRLSV